MTGLQFSACRHCLMMSCGMQCWEAGKYENPLFLLEVSGHLPDLQRRLDFAFLRIQMHTQWECGALKSKSKSKPGRCYVWPTCTRKVQHFRQGLHSRDEASPSCPSLADSEARKMAEAMEITEMSHMWQAKLTSFTVCV